MMSMIVYVVDWSIPLLSTIKSLIFSWSMLFTRVFIAHCTKTNRLLHFMLLFVLFFFFKIKYNLNNPPLKANWKVKHTHTHTHTRKKINKDDNYECFLFSNLRLFSFKQTTKTTTTKTLINSKSKNSITF